MPTSKLIKDSLLIGIPDIAGALVAGMPAWIAVWVLCSYEANYYHPCPKRTTLAVTIIAVVLLFKVGLERNLLECGARSGIIRRIREYGGRRDSFD